MSLITKGHITKRQDFDTLSEPQRHAQIVEKKQWQ